MSHVPQRKEKDCLNCGTTVVGRFCHVCGQENVIPKETFWHMVTHFFYDITHFDSSFFHTVHHLIMRPGFLSKEYMLGRRAVYLHPVRMYVFTSAIFFLLFFSVFNVNKNITTNLDDNLSLTERKAMANELKESYGKDSANSLLIDGLAKLHDTSNIISNKDALTYFINKPNFIKYSGRNYSSVHEYDSVQQSLPAAKRDGWFMRRLMEKVTAINEKYSEDPEEAFKKFGESLLHRIPYMLFVSLPLFALLLKLVYVRRRQFYYADHGVFTIHLYIFTFLLLIAVFGLSALRNTTGWGFIDFIIGALFIMLFFYLYKAMRNFYGQRRGKTFIKFLIVALFSLVMLLILFLLFMFFSAYTL